MDVAVFGARCTLRYEMDLQFFNVTGNSKMLSLRKFLPKHVNLEEENKFPSSITNLKVASCLLFCNQEFSCLPEVELINLN
jgi:hypothetical protein